jgi:Spy/CpxP family protein refolding chaperone
MTRRQIHRTATVLTAVAATAVVWGGVTIGAAVVGAVPAALAQDAPGGAPQGGGAPRDRGRFGKVLMTLGLSDGQKSQIRQIMKDARAQNHDVTDPQQRRTNMRAALAKVEAVLTPAQRDDLHKKMQAMRQQPPQQRS